MIKLTQTVAAWGQEDFREQFKQEVEQLTAEHLPLQQGLEHSSYVSADPFKVMVINEEESGDTIRIKAGVFYSGIIAGCNCSDDPTPPDVLPEYCDLQFDIDMQSAEATVSLLGN